MNRYLLRVFFFVFGWQIIAGQLYSQEALSTDRYVESYFSKASMHSVIYTGKEEVRYPTYMLNHPYLYTNEYKEGLLSFDGVVYPNVFLRLNQHTEELIIYSPDKRFNIILPTNRVDYATIDSFYIFYNYPERGIEALPKGYYVRLHDGLYPVLKRETGFIQSTIKDMTIEFSFAMRNKVYVFKDGTYYLVSGKRSVLKLFKTKKRELKRFINDNDLDFRKSMDNSVVAVTRYYETLIP